MYIFRIINGLYSSLQLCWLEMLYLYSSLFKSEMQKTMQGQSNEKELWKSKYEHMQGFCWLEVSWSKPALL